jgi:3-deoxy-D-manno-octulosonic-acid transferase
MYLIYSSALVLALLFALPYYIVRFRKYLPTLRERLGFVEARTGEPPIWIHAVSVGELRAVDRLIRAVRQRGPQPIVISTTTPAGRALAMDREDVDQVVYFPLDLGFAVRRTLDRLRPEKVIVAETEIWPNFLRQCSRRGIPVFMVNGRISDRSFRNYRRARRWLNRVLGLYTLLGMQSETDASRISQMGAPADRVVVFGNLKYDLPRLPPGPDPALARTLQAWQPLLVGASTASGEDAMLLEAFRRLGPKHPRLKLLLAPRRPERFDQTARAIEAAGFSCCRRSDLAQAGAAGDVLLLDSIGELDAVFRFASVVFMGGTLVPRGGHNILEAVRFGKPVVFGPYMDNFRDMAREFLDAGAAVLVSGPGELAEGLDRVLSDPALVRSLAASGMRLVEKNAGATDRAIEAIFPVPTSAVAG